MRKLTSRDLEDLAHGACILASGGGGSIGMKEPLLKILKSDGPVKLAGLDEIGDDDFGVVVAVAAPPLAAKDPKTVSGLADAVAKAFLEMQKALGKPLRFTAAIETGVGNSLFPMIAAVRNNAVVVDGAGARRSVPSLTMCTFADLPIAPVQLVNVKGHVLSYTVPDAAAAEQPMMAIVTTQEFGSAGALAFWPMSGKTAKANTSKNTVSETIALGATLRKAPAKRKVEAAAESLNGIVLFEGTIDGVSQRAAGGFDFTVVTLKNKTSEVFRICAQNESLIAWSSVKAMPLVMGPDLICYLAKDGAVFSNADLDLVQGKPVAVIAAPAPADLRKPHIEEAFLQALAGLGYFGPYVPLEVLREMGQSHRPSARATSRPGQRVQSPRLWWHSGAHRKAPG